MEQRRIMSLGRSSLVISLPKYWTRLNELKQGDVVSIAMNRDRSLVVFPGMKKEKEVKRITLHVSEDDKVFHIIRSIIACYLNGYSDIKLVSNRFFKATQQKVIRDVVRKLYMRIMEADAKQIRITTLIDESKAPIETGIKRMYTLSSSMCRDVLLALKNNDMELAKTVYTLDDEVDHFSFLLLRLIRKAATDPTLANQLKIDALDCLDYQTFVHRIEQIADQAANMAKSIILLHGKRKKISEHILDKMYLAGNTALDLYEKAVNSLFSNDLKSSEEVMMSKANLEKLDHEIASLAFLKEKSTAVICACCSIRDSILRIAEFASDIAEITISRFYKPSS
jgi:phosphate uptake regulator